MAVARWLVPVDLVPLGEALAGGPKQYDAKETLASLKGKIG